MRTNSHSLRLLVVVLATALPACKAEHGSLGNHASDTGTGGDEGVCGQVELADVLQGDGGFALGGDVPYEGPGWSVSGVGDMNGDGLADVITSDRFYDRESGRTYVVFGKEDTGNVSLDDLAQGIGGFVIDGDDEIYMSGRSISGAGDVNGDGIPDVVIGANLARNANGERSGRAFVVFGKANSDPVELADVASGTGGFVMDGEEEQNYCGVSVSGAGDINGDGLADVIVGAPRASSEEDLQSGRAYVVFGKADGDAVSLEDVAQGLGGFVLDGAGEYDSTGLAVSGAGDVNGDGIADVIVGAPRSLDWVGRAYVVFGKADTDRVLLADVAAGNGGFVLDGEAEIIDTGGSVGGAGDVNGDGLADVIIGALQGDPGGAPNAGRTYVVFGKADTEAVMLADVAAGSGGFFMDGEDAGESSAQSVATVGDLNGDGLPEVITGAPQADDGGRAYVLFGRTDTGEVLAENLAQGIGGFVFNGENTECNVGSAVSGAGDVNGDGRPDLIVGSLGCTFVIFGGDFSCEGG